MLPTHHHAVQFYSHQVQLFGTASGFLSEGLISGQPALVIATRAHREGILDAMRGRHIDVDQAQRVGEIVALDAGEELSRIMIEGRPDRDCFEGGIGSLIDRAASGRPHATVRVYGEMVDVLWTDGLTGAALDLETLWNGLAKRHRFSLLCGYAAGHFTTQVEQFQSICEHHTHVIGPDAGLTIPNRRHDLS